MGFPCGRLRLPGFRAGDLVAGWWVLAVEGGFGLPLLACLHFLLSALGLCDLGMVSSLFLGLGFRT